VQQRRDRRQVLGSAPAAASRLDRRMYVDVARRTSCRTYETYETEHSIVNCELSWMKLLLVDVSYHDSCSTPVRTISMFPKRASQANDPNIYAPSNADFLRTLRRPDSILDVRSQ
jgi:hypothetical protein